MFSLLERVYFFRAPHFRLLYSWANFLAPGAQLGTQIFQEMHQFQYFRLITSLIASPKASLTKVCLYGSLQFLRGWLLSTNRLPDIRYIVNCDFSFALILSHLSFLIHVIFLYQLGQIFSKHDNENFIITIAHDETALSHKIDHSSFLYTNRFDGVYIVYTAHILNWCLQ